MSTPEVTILSPLPHDPILAPMMALVLWTFVMTSWMYATRIPAITKHRIPLNNKATISEFYAKLPAEVRWKSDNLNNLMEQPTLFYAICTILAITHQGHGLNLTLAWLYVGLRVVHSLIQSVINKITLRFSVFILCTIVIFILGFRASTVVLF
eukprot:TRINITY_DN3381_c0_g1_i1.p1 TRINITY_DN3381_c0_g1~~TRINITY_DN3381_c0_g1_i1.p1  ORF type:complete len:153 (+),score=25.24 TRINITY_DN3381_c0_g1_i1:87-545(+)